MKRIFFPIAALAATVCLASLVIAAPSARSTSQPTTPPQLFQVTHAINAPGMAKGQWNQGILIDKNGKFAYLLGGGYTDIVEADTGKEVGKISTCWSNGVALVPESNRGFVSTGQWGVIIFDLQTHKQIGKINLNAALGQILYDDFSKKLLVVKSSDTLDILSPDTDLKNGKPEMEIKLQGEQRGMVADGAGMVYVTVTGNDDIHEHVAVLDTRTMEIVATWIIPQGVGQATGISMDRLHSRLFIACAGKLLVMSATDGHDMAQLPVGHVSGGWVGCGTTAFSNGKIFASCGDRTFTILGQAPNGAFEVQQVLPDLKNVTAFAIHPQTGAVYVPTIDPDKNAPDTGVNMQIVEPAK